MSRKYYFEKIESPKNANYLQCVVFTIDFGIFVQKLYANRVKAVFIELIRNKSIH